MNARIPAVTAAQRRSRHGAIIASLVGAVALLAGCSSSSDSTSGEVGMAPEDAMDTGYVQSEAFGGDESLVAADANAAAPMVDAERSLIVTGNIYITVDDPTTAANDAADIVQDAGGRIDARSEVAPDQDEGEGGSASLTLRIPTGDLDAVVDKLRTLGQVDQFATDSYDVTTEVTDLEARLSTLRASTKRIEALLVDAKDISDIIKLEGELDSRQTELESLEAHQRGLNDQVSMSSIGLTLTTQPVIIVDDSPDSFWDGLASGWDALTGFLAGALIVVGVLLPWLAVMAFIGLAVVAIVRSRKARARRRSPAVTETQTPAPTPTA